MSQYDPNVNPRHLDVVADEEDEKELESVNSKMEEELGRLNREIAMFRSAGWRGIRDQLNSELSLAVMALAGDKLNTMEAVAFVRGQIRALQFLLSLHDEKVQRRDYILQLQQQLKHAEE